MFAGMGLGETSESLTPSHALIPSCLAPAVPCGLIRSSVKTAHAPPPLGSPPAWVRVPPLGWRGPSASFSQHRSQVIQLPTLSWKLPKSRVWLCLICVPLSPPQSLTQMSCPLQIASSLPALPQLESRMWGGDGSRGREGKDWRRDFSVVQDLLELTKCIWVSGPVWRGAWVSPCHGTASLGTPLALHLGWSPGGLRE